MSKQWKDSVFQTDKRVRLGIWGLGRGHTFFRTCAVLNIDVVAGCDFNAHMRERFLKDAPDAFVTENDEEFLAQDFDAVLLATFCPSHGPDAVRCLEAGKHVLSEVTAFHTPAEGVRLVEEVERTGLVYQMAENYPYSAANMYLAHKWREGLFGELMYAECEYVHEIRSLCYTYIDGVPIQPGNTVHNWRSWINFHYYNTHSLGPVMRITGARPVQVVSLLGTQLLPGYPAGQLDAMGGIAPSLIRMNNGGLMRNLMGSTTNDSHLQRLWGTNGAAEIVDGRLFLRLGACGSGPKMEVAPKWPELADHAERTGHGGGDFWVLYYFARQILLGEDGPFDVYVASDCTLPGILAYRSMMEGGKPLDVPDFRKRSERSRYRNDDGAQPRFDVERGCFPKRADARLTGEFTTIMNELIGHATAYRAWADWARILDDAKEPERVLALADGLIQRYPAMRNTMRKARRLADAYPQSAGARVLREMLALADEKQTMGRGFLDDLKERRGRLNGVARKK
jgi:predicted dehydrogenase